MKVCLLLLSLLVVAHCQIITHDTLAQLVMEEVRTIMQADRSLDMAGCNAKCDAEFIFDGHHHNEATTDSYCAEACLKYFQNHPPQEPVEA